MRPGPGPNRVSVISLRDHFAFVAQVLSECRSITFRWHARLETERVSMTPSGRIPSRSLSVIRPSSALFTGAYDVPRVARSPS